MHFPKHREEGGYTKLLGRHIRYLCLVHEICVLCSTSYQQGKEIFFTGKQHVRQV